MRFNVCVIGIPFKNKKDLWKHIEQLFNASAASPRWAEKNGKWDNLVSKHRALYADFLRESRMTGRCNPLLTYIVSFGEKYHQWRR